MTGDAGYAPSPASASTTAGPDRAAILEAEAHDSIRLARAIHVLPPDSRDLALRTAGLPLLPIDRELGEIIGPIGMRLPPLARPRGAAQGDPVLIPAGDEHVRTDRGAIDAMLPRRQVFRAAGLMEGGRALGLIDGGGGRVHLREQVGRGRRTRLADMHPVPGPLRVACLPIACLRIVGGLDRRRRGDWLRLKRTRDLAGWLCAVPSPEAHS